MTLTDYSCFEGIPEHFIISEKDGGCYYECLRCGDNKKLGDAGIEWIHRFARDMHTACKKKEDKDGSII